MRLNTAEVPVRLGSPAGFVRLALPRACAGPLLFFPPLSISLLFFFGLILVNAAARSPQIAFLLWDLNYGGKNPAVRVRRQLVLG